MTGAIHRHAAFGARWCADLPLPQFDAWDEACDRAATPDILVRRVAALPLRTPVREGSAVFADGLRFAWRDEVAFDLRDGASIDYLPGPNWTGTMPAAFYSTVAALTLTWRGALPCHASAIEVAGTDGGRAVLIAGTGGAGKSTLTAALLGNRATLIGDDLSIVTQASADAPFVVARGRPSIRLHPDFAARVPALLRAPVLGDDRGKWLVRPVARSRRPAVPLAGFVMLGAADGRLPGQTAALLLAQHLFRPRWLRLLPGHADRLRMVFALARRIPCIGVASTGSFHADAEAVARARHTVLDLATGAGAG